MGFWHTGYIEFHEEFLATPLPVAMPRPKPPRRPESTNRPALYVRGQEAGHYPLVVAHPLGLDDIELRHCNRAAINGTEFTIQEAARRLTSMRHDVAIVNLFGTRSSKTTVSLDFQIATKEDLDMIDKAFEAMRKRNQLDVCIIDLFISETQHCKTALPYCSGIVSYLHGIIAKERHRQSGLPYESYQSHFKSAALKLAAYNRPVARAITALVSFHFNQFSDAANCNDLTRVAAASRIFHIWINRINDIPLRQQEYDAMPNTLEVSLTDFETECILRWTCKPEYRLRYINSIEVASSAGNLAEYDIIKLHILLAEEYLKIGNRKCANEHAKELSNLTAFAPWANTIIDRASSRGAERGD